MPPMIRKVGAVLEMIKVVVHRIQSASGVLDAPESIGATGFRTL
jgi:hypothetical protein